MSEGTMPVCLGRPPIGLGIFRGGSVTYDTSNYWTPKENLARPKAETGNGSSGNISYVKRFQRSGLRGFPIGVSIYHGGSVSSDTSNYRRPISNGPDRMRKLELGCLEISVRSGSSTPVGCGVGIYRGGSVSSDTSNYRASM